MSNSRDDNSALIPSEVRELIEESRTVQDWLDRLASHESDASPEVFARVRKDYEGRLEQAASSLARHRSELASSLETRQSELAQLQDDRDSQAADLEEARLRHVVGEYTDERWAEVKESVEGSLSDLTELLDMEEGAVAELAAIVASIDEGRIPTVSLDSAQAVEDAPAEDAGDAADQVDVAVAGDAAPGDDERDDVEAAGESRSAGEPDEQPTGTGEAEADDDAVADVIEAESEGEDAVSDDSSVEITVEPTQDEPEGAPVSASADAEDADEGGDYLDELEFLESLSLDDSDRFDAVSAMLDEEDSDKKK